MINGLDYTLIDNAFNTQSASLAAIMAPSVTSAAAQVTLYSATQKAASFAMDIFSTQTRIALVESTQQSIELSMQKKDLLDQLSFAQ